MFATLMIFLSFTIIGFCVIAIWGLLPHRATDNFIFRSVLWMSAPARAGVYIRRLFVAIPLIYALFWSWRVGIPLTAAAVLLTIFNGRYLASLSRE